MKTVSLANPFTWFKLLLQELMTAVLLFPLIYYSTALGRVAVWVRNQATWFERLFAFRLSVKTLFTPLYGDYTKQGRVASFVVRLMLLFFRTLGFVVSLLVLGGLFVLYGLLPFAVILLLMMLI